MRKGFAFSARLCGGGGELLTYLPFKSGGAFIPFGLFFVGTCFVAGGGAS